ncbi:5'-AMP-activated protein kinase subunit beta-2-like isoform X2 [Xenia sp. Carnegie-2017]|uniref:5'-AMP-activated protein kinase subunit beta-2-like isoform X2 n=1 Tax=Xenia sp. Carnegie-2017 TaxID=2897299 RepID=UPI001F046F41|nr:5'-AMP-activated protein kinase subunit beta-2-like isoform X2 [Xenia sp. Carnegie-2017]
MGQGSSGMVVGKPERSTDSSLEFQPGHKNFASSEMNKRLRSNTDSQMDYQSSDDKEEDIPKCTSDSSILPRTVPTMFKWENGGNIVYLSGSFNEWNSRIPLHGSNGEFFTIIELHEGDHEYKFFVDGHWVHDPNAPTTNDNFGGRNNISVKKSDFEKMEALDDDDRQSGSEPHHVSLNHLYALSIKEGVTVLSTTQRYREKYVTTLLYRPIHP